MDVLQLKAMVNDWIRMDLWCIYNNDCLLYCYVYLFTIGRRNINSKLYTFSICTSVYFVLFFFKQNSDMPKITEKRNEKIE